MKRQPHAPLTQAVAAPLHENEESGGGAARCKEEENQEEEEEDLEFDPYMFESMVASRGGVIERGFQPKEEEEDSS